MSRPVRIEFSGALRCPVSYTHTHEGQASHFPRKALTKSLGVKSLGVRSIFYTSSDVAFEKSLGVRSILYTSSDVVFEYVTSNSN